MIRPNEHALCGGVEGMILLIRLNEHALCVGVEGMILLIRPNEHVHFGGGGGDADDKTQSGEVVGANRGAPG